MIERVLHPLEPVADAGSRVLLLGTMPSPKSREAGFYYAHPQNRFWRVLAALWGEETPAGTQERLAFARRHHIALWDVLRACSIEGADDGSIRQPGTGSGGHPRDFHHRHKGGGALPPLLPAGYRAAGHPAALHQPGQLPCHAGRAHAGIPGDSGLYIILL